MLSEFRHKFTLLRKELKLLQQYVDPKNSNYHSLAMKTFCDLC